MSEWILCCEKNWKSENQYTLNCYFILFMQKWITSSPSDFSQFYLMFYQEYTYVVSEWTWSCEKNWKSENQYMYNYYFFCSCENELYNYSIKPSLSTTSIMDRQLLCQSKSNTLSNENINTGVSVIFKTKPELECQNELSFLLKRKSLRFHYWDYLTSFWRNNWQPINDG